jgi:hypothetical protein
LGKECKPAQREINASARRELVGRYDGGKINPEGYGLLLLAKARRSSAAVTAGFSRRPGESLPAGR